MSPCARVTGAKGTTNWRHAKQGLTACQTLTEAHDGCETQTEDLRLYWQTPTEALRSSANRAFAATGVFRRRRASEITEIGPIPSVFDRIAAFPSVSRRNRKSSAGVPRESDPFRRCLGAQIPADRGWARMLRTRGAPVAHKATDKVL